METLTNKHGFKILRKHQSFDKQPGRSKLLKVVEKMSCSVVRISTHLELQRNARTLTET